MLTQTFKKRGRGQVDKIASNNMKYESFVSSLAFLAHKRYFPPKVSQLKSKHASELKGKNHSTSHHFAAVTTMTMALFVKTKLFVHPHNLKVTYIHLTKI